MRLSISNCARWRSEFELDAFEHIELCALALGVELDAFEHIELCALALGLELDAVEHVELCALALQDGEALAFALADHVELCAFALGLELHHSPLCAFVPMYLFGYSKEFLFGRSQHRRGLVMHVRLRGLPQGR